MSNGRNGSYELTGIHAHHREVGEVDGESRSWVQEEDEREGREEENA